ncbi:VOC family protein [Streptomyces sp. NRRL S-340]|uniref:VOC family protein n=1 Tax=Streptomyces sp. NRRL S-340 TaxID=1463901 RepID=UPI00055E3D5A|nr:VOC family protein [Streptomyces sp. NRRL S-340]
MAVRREGTPCWADAMFTDLEQAKTFYGEVLGWTFGESSTEYGNYTEAYADGKAVAAVVPPVPGQEGQSQWCLYFASPDAEATARRIRDHGGEVLMEPMRVGDFGTMCLAREPSGAVFGVWQAGTHQGFEATETPGAYCWAELLTRDPGAADAFLTSVFGYTTKQIEDEAIDFRLFGLDDETVLGRMRMTDDFPPEVPSYLNVYFTVADCDAAVAAATRLGGALRYGPVDTPFGRLAVLGDPQGAHFSVIDITTTQGEKPQVKNVP